MLALMVVLVFGNVVMRYAFNSGFTLSRGAVALAVRVDDLSGRRGGRSRARPPGHRHAGFAPAGGTGKRMCLGATYLLMLYLCWLLLRGAWQQTLINWTSTSAVMQVSMAILYVSGVVFAVLGHRDAGRQLWRLLSGQRDAHLSEAGIGRSA
jgi:TRAP-type C4-dicarboxylate transport system permease small subunit